MTPARIFAALLCTALLAACSSGEPAPESSLSTGTSEPVALSGTSWTLTQVAIDGELRNAVDASASLNFESDGTLAGSTGCNRFAGTWSADGSQLTLEPGALTAMACLEEGRQEQETGVIAALTATASYGVAADALTLTDAQGDALATYQAASLDLSSTSWQATGVNNGKGAVSSTTLTPKLTLNFDDSDQVSGFGGCTDFAGTFTAQAPAITLSALGPAAVCEPATEGATAQSEYLTALGAATTYRIDGNRLELRDDSGALQAGFTAAG